MGSRTIVVHGEMLVDVFGQGDEQVEVPGGAPMNVAIHLARAGHRVRMVSRVGEDARGERLLALLRDEGVDTELVGVDPDAPTGWVSVELGSDGEPSYRIHEGVAWDRTALPAGAPEGDVLYYNTLAARTPAGRAVQEQLLERGYPWQVMDVNLRQQHWSPEGLATGVRRARLLKLNEHELGPVARALGVEPEAGAVLAACPDLELLCTTLGPEGARLGSRTAPELHVPAVPGPVVDTVGAGDALCAALVEGLLAGEEPGVALAAASRRAAEVVGTRGALPPREPSP